eukprot:TRINITY_DN1279_c0_g1_i2.p1 TRINITY_DN1279_c0_g1~~TRINITY_DN1279_c0_g1_i2.p1  ORF type:complete len:192 (+),score=39.85 TRINITY_DN1279_c0_g1_i2:140-715(+)
MVGTSWDGVASRYGQKTVDALNKLQEWASRSKQQWEEATALRDQLRSAGVPDAKLSLLFPLFDEKSKLFYNGFAVVVQQFGDASDESRSPLDRTRATVEYLASQREEVKRLHANANTGMAEQWADLKQNSPTIVQSLDPDSESVYNNLTARTQTANWYFRVLLLLEEVLKSLPEEGDSAKLKQQVRVLWKR